MIAATHPRPYTALARAQAREGEGRKSRSAEREELQAVDRPATSAGHAQTTKEYFPETK